MTRPNSQKLAFDRHVLFTKEEDQRLREIAKAEDRSVGNLLRVLVNEALKARDREVDGSDE